MGDGLAKDGVGDRVFRLWPRPGTRIPPFASGSCRRVARAAGVEPVPALGPERCRRRVVPRRLVRGSCLGARDQRQERIHERGLAATSFSRASSGLTQAALSTSGNSRRPEPFGHSIMNVLLWMASVRRSRPLRRMRRPSCRSSARPHPVRRDRRVGSGEPSSSSNSRRADRSGSFALLELSFRDRPCACVTVPPERTAHVDDQQLHPAVARGGTAAFRHFASRSAWRVASRCTVRQFRAVP